LSFYGKIAVKIKGLTPLLMDRLDPETLKSKGAKMRTEDTSVEEQAARSAYRAVIDDKEQLFIPAEAVYSMLIGSSGIYKIGRMSASRVLAGSIHIEPEKIPLGTNEYEVDVRAINTRQSGRILKGRAKIPSWEATFTLVYDKTIIPAAFAKDLKEILDTGGRRTGLLSYRPQHKGWFGTFTVEKFEEVETQ